MSAEIVLVNDEQFNSQEYHTEWKLINLLKLKNKRLQTARFCPVPNLDLQFRFEVSFQVYDIGNIGQFSIFKLLIDKADSSTVPTQMKLQVEMKILYSDGTTFIEFRELPVIKVNEMDKFYFDDVRNVYYNNTTQIQLSFHGIKMRNDTLIMKCQMKLFDFDSVNQSNLFCSLKSLDISSGDNNPFQRADDRSDIVIRAGGKSFFAHGALLAALSPVFKDVISNNYNKLVVISDSTSEAFDCFLEYLYTGNLEAKSESVVRELYVLAAKYEILSLKEECALFIASNISVDNVCKVLDMTFDYGDEHLKKIVTEFVAKEIGCSKDSIQ